MKTLVKNILFSGSLLVAALSLTAETIKPSPAPAWELKDTSGKTVKFSDFKGKVVILDFWATWCGPCRQEIPGFIELQKQYGSKGLAVIGISLDDPEKLSSVQAFIKENKINYPIVMGDEKTTDIFGGIEGMPTTFIIDRKGNIVTKHLGFYEKEVFEKEIKPLLESVK